MFLVELLVKKNWDYFLNEKRRIFLARQDDILCCLWRLQSIKKVTVCSTRSASWKVFLVNSESILVSIYETVQRSCLQTRKSCFSYRTGFYYYTVLLFMINSFNCTAASIKLLLLLRSFYCFNSVSPVSLFLWSLYCFLETSTASKMFLISTALL